MCENYDVWFVADVSFFNQGDIATFRETITEITSRMDFVTGNTRVGIIEYAEGVYERLRVTDGTSQQAVRNALRNFGSTPAGSNSGQSGRELGAALQTVISRLNTDSRPDEQFPNVVFHLTGGYPYNDDLVGQLSQIRTDSNTINNRAVSTERPAISCVTIFCLSKTKSDKSSA